MDNKNLPAFPTLVYNEISGAPNGHYKGFTKRELGALIIAAGKVAQQPAGYYSKADADAVAMDAIRISDAIFNELSKDTNDLP